MQGKMLLEKDLDKFYFGKKRKDKEKDRLEKFLLTVKQQAMMKA